MHESDFKIAIITALPIELSCMEGMLDEQYEDLPQSASDNNTYTYGRIGRHNVVLACLPAREEKVVSAANVAGRIINSFPKFKFGLMVGIAGGVSDMETDQENDVRLGDIVVSKPSRIFGGVVQYNQGKVVASGLDHGGDFVRTGALRGPPDELLSAIPKLESKRVRLGSDMPRYLSEMFEKYPRLKQLCPYPGVDSDLLFEAEYNHQGRSGTCQVCDASRLVNRPARTQHDPVVFYGTIASDNQLIKHGTTRDRIAKGLGALCFEMEAAGLMNDFPCLVIRGICDYADSHKNKNWQPYASAVAAAYAKELLYTIPKERIDHAPIHEERNDLRDISKPCPAYHMYIRNFRKKTEANHRLIETDQCVQCRSSQTIDRRFQFLRSRICGDLVCSNCYEQIVQQGQEKCARPSCQKFLQGFDFLLVPDSVTVISSANQSQIAETHTKPQTAKDGTSAIDSSTNAQLQLAKYNCAKSQHLCQGHIQSLSFSQDGQISMVGEGVPRLNWYIWKPWQPLPNNLEDIKPMYKHIDTADNQLSNNGGSFILSAEGGRIYLRQVQHPSKARYLSYTSGDMSRIMWSWHDEVFATWGPNKVIIWKYTGSDWQRFLSFRDIPGEVYGLTFSRTNDKLTCVGKYGVFFLDFDRQRVKASSLYSIDRPFNAKTLILSPDGTLVAHWVELRGPLQISDTESGKRIFEINERDIRHTFSGPVVFSSNNKKIAVGSGTAGSRHIVSIWNIETAALEARIGYFNHAVTAMSFIPNTANVAIGFFNGQVAIYKASETGLDTV